MATITQRVAKNARRRGVVVLGRREWGSKLPHVYAWRRIFRKAKSPADTIVQHITVTTPSGDFKADVRTVESIGQSRFQSGVSYNWLVDMRTGHVAVGQPLDAKGTHTLNDKGIKGYTFDQNLVARAIAVIGQPGTQLSHAAKLAITRLIAAMIDEGAVTRSPDYDPHSKFAFKDCPCDATRNEMPDILAGAKRLVKK